MKNDDFGDRMKGYENVEARRCLPIDVPILARIDGKKFSHFTKGLHRPYDERLRRLMVDTTRYLMEETGAVAGYTQSDEITLLFRPDVKEDGRYLGGRVQKMCSIFAGTATAYFCAGLPEVLPEKAGKMPTFDCRVWSVPDEAEASNVFVWRQLDATKNAASMAAMTQYSHNQLLNKSTKEKIDMLKEKGTDFHGYPACWRRGQFLVRRTFTRAFTSEEIARLPLKHEARANPELLVERGDIVEVDLNMVHVGNRADVLFRGALPMGLPWPTTRE